MNPNLTVIQECRLCQSKQIASVLSFGLSPLANSYPTSKTEKEDLYPLTVMLCEDCGHVQLRETVNPNVLFSNYLYASSDSPSLQKHFNQYAKTVVLKLLLNELDKVLEIGCNDGILLKEFLALGLTQLVGVEPAGNIAQVAREKTNLPIYNSFFSDSVAVEILRNEGKFNLITANNVFAHVASLDSMTAGIKRLLADDGVFVFENAYLLDTIRNLYFDQVYHEHLQYYGIKPLVKYFAKYDMEIFDVEHVDTQGGSFRAYVKHKNNTKIQIQSSVAKMIEDEEDFKLYDKKTYITFKVKLEKLRNELFRITERAIGLGNTISCYGCPAKFTLFSKFFGLNSDIISYVVDDSPLKQGRFSPGAKIPIVSKDFFKQNTTDYCIVSVWNMAQSIINNNTWYKGYFVVPMPEVKVIKHV